MQYWKTILILKPGAHTSLINEYILALLGRPCQLFKGDILQNFFTPLKVRTRKSGFLTYYCTSHSKTYPPLMVHKFITSCCTVRTEQRDHIGDVWKCSISRSIGNIHNIWNTLFISPFYVKWLQLCRGHFTKQHSLSLWQEDRLEMSWNCTVKKVLWAWGM